MAKFVKTLHPKSGQIQILGSSNPQLPMSSPQFYDITTTSSPTNMSFVRKHTHDRLY